MKIAIVEDDISMRKSLQYSLADYEISCFKNPADALAAGVSGFEIIISDINMPKMDGLAFIKAAKEAGCTADFIIITGNASLSKSIEALRLGVRDFLTKPFGIEELEQAIKNICKVRATLAKPAAAEAKPAPAKKPAKKPSSLESEFFIATSPALNEAITLAKKAAATEISVLLNGPSGAGKEVFARFIHAASPRANKPFVAINMAALPHALCESELFGYAKGAFTDATKDKDGLFKLANGGTLFLDEIGEMPAELQSKILRAVQERCISPLGSTKSIPIDVRIISATNINIQQAIASKDFRADLFYRLGAFCVQIPALQNRREEILPLFRHFYESACAEFGTTPQKLGAKAASALENYPFEGNIRELISIAQRAAILADGEIKVQDLCLLNYQGES